MSRRLPRVVGLALVAVLAAGSLTAPAPAADPEEADVAAAAPISAAPDISAYENLGAWIDIYDDFIFDRPERWVRRLDRQNVTTLYVETANYTRPYAIYRPTDQAKLIRAAHRKDMDVVAWYLPGLVDPDLDFKRTMAAIRFHRNGQRFDSFALDIEASAVRSQKERSDRLVRLSRRIDNAVANNYPLGAIIPSPRGMQLVQGYWENFPYQRIAPYYDVWLPMGYYSYRVSGRQAVYDYTALNTEIIRDELNDPNVPIHAIGGLAHRSSASETRGFTEAVIDDGILGGGLYDVALMDPHDWQELQPIAS